MQVTAKAPMNVNITKNEPMAARWVLRGETFERKSVEYVALTKATTTREAASFLVRALYPDGSGEVTMLELPAQLELFITGRWVP